MSLNEILAEIPKLSFAEREELVRRAIEVENESLTADEKAILEERLATFRQKAVFGHPADGIKQEPSHRSKPPITVFEKTSLLVSGVAIVISLLTWVDTRNHQRRETAFNAVATVDFLREMTAIGAPYKTVHVRISNASRFATTIEVVVKANGFSLHELSSDQHPDTYADEVTLPTDLIRTESIYKHDICVHVLSPRPETGSLTFVINGVERGKFVYQRVKDGDKYVQKEREGYFTP